MHLLLARQAAEAEGLGRGGAPRAERGRPVFEAAADHAQLARMWRLLGYVYATACRYGVAATSAEEAIEHARMAGDVRQEARA